MLIARVIGEVVSSQKHPSHEGRKSLLVQPLQLDGTNRGDAVIALDAVDAGVGDRVLLVTEGYSAMTAVGRPDSPIDMAVIGVIDSLDFDLNGSSVHDSVRPGRGPADAGFSLSLEPLGSGGQQLLLPSVPVKKKPARKQEPNQ